MKGKTPLLYAARVGHLEAILNIIKVGGDVNLRTEFTGESSIYLAAEAGHTIIVSELISYQADVNTPNVHGISPLFIASQVGNVEIVKLLLDANAQFTSVQGITPLMIAAIRGNSEVVKLFTNTKDIDLDQQNNLGETALMLCTVSRDLLCVQHLIEHGSNYNITDKKGYNVLIHATIRNCVEIVDYLVNHGGDMEFRDLSGLTALQHAQERSNHETLNKLLELGANIPQSGFRYRISREVKRKRDELFEKKIEESKKQTEELLEENIDSRIKLTRMSNNMAKNEEL